MLSAPVSTLRREVSARMIRKSYIGSSLPAVWDAWHSSLLSCGKCLLTLISLRDHFPRTQRALRPQIEYIIDTPNGVA